jgi:hypothetical protein
VTDEEGHFAFHDLPVASYVLAVKAPTSGSPPIASSFADVDLRQEPSQEVVLALAPAPGDTMSITVTSADGPLPFAWLTAEDGSVLARAFPVDAKLDVFDLPQAMSGVVITAPGYYSHATAVNGKENAVTVALEAQPASETIPWANGEIFVAAGSVVADGEQGLQVERGWVWGDGGSPHPYVLRVGDISVSLYESRFALEVQPGQPARFYLLAGKADLLDPDRVEPTPMFGPQVVELNVARPMPLTPVVFAALEAKQRVAPPDAMWQPGLRAQLRDRLTLLGVGSAQVITFVTYLLGIFSVAAIPVLLISLFIRRRARRD